MTRERRGWLTPLTFLTIALTPSLAHANRRKLRHPKKEVKGVYSARVDSQTDSLHPKELVDTGDVEGFSENTTNLALTTNWTSTGLELINPITYYRDLLYGKSDPYLLNLTFEQIRSLSFTQVDSLLQTLEPAGAYESLPASSHPADTQVFAGYLYLISQNTMDGLNAGAAQLRSSLSMAQLAQIIELTFDGLNDNYSESRSNNYNGSSISPLALEENLSASPLQQGGAPTLGICRDFVVLATTLAHGFGFTNVYSFSMNWDGAHVKMIAQDPSHPGQIYTMSAGAFETNASDQGVASLTQKADFSTEYQIFDYRGKQVAQMPSDLGELIQEAAGGNIEVIDPLLRNPQGTLTTGGIQTPSVRIQGFTAVTQEGQEVAGVGATVTRGDPQGAGISVESTSSIGYLNQPDPAQPLTPSHAVIATESLAAHANTNWAYLGPKLTSLQVRSLTTPTLLVSATVDGINNQNPGPPSTGESMPVVAVDQKVEVKKEFADDNTSVIKATVGTQWGLGISNVSAFVYDHPYANVSYVEVSGEDKHLPRRLSFMFDAFAAIRTFGPQGFAQVGIKQTDDEGHPLWKISGGAQGQLSASNFNIAPMSEKRYFVMWDINTKKGLVVNATARKPINSGFENSSFELGIKKGFNANPGKRHEDESPTLEPSE